MNIPELLVLATPVAAWGFALALPSTRNRRAVTFFAAWTALWVAAQLAPAQVTAVVRTLLVGIGTLALASPERLGVGSWSLKEQEIDKRLGRTPAETAAAEDAPQDWDAIEAIVAHDPRRRLVVRLRRWAAARFIDSRVAISPTPSRYFDLAADHYLRDAAWQRVIGRKPTVSAWDEEIALRCFFEEAKVLISRASFADRPAVPLGPWEAEVRILVEGLDAAPFTDLVIRDTRRLLVAALEADLRIATGDHSMQARQDQEAAARAMTRGWELARQRVAETGQIPASLGH